MVNKKYGLRQIGKYGFKLCLEVYNKFNHRCSICANENKLAIHHIDNSGQSKNPNNNIDNLQLICIKCHVSLHSKQYWAKEAEKRGGYLWKGREKEWHLENNKKWNEIYRKQKKAVNYV
jgi:hypothetical protein